jgi:SAM-dependent methyltransferase
VAPAVLFLRINPGVHLDPSLPLRKPLHLDSKEPHRYSIEVKKTQSSDYAERLVKIESRFWRRYIDVQAPYRFHMQRLKLGFTLDIGAGIGRNLNHLNGHGVGVDHNLESVRLLRERGLTGFTPEEFIRSEFAKPGRFDSLLLSHVVEHLEPTEALQLVAAYLPYLRDLGRVVMITPQLAGYRSDPTHVTYVDSQLASEWLIQLGLSIEQRYSYPFPKWVGPYFRHNEYVTIGRKQMTQSTR